MESSFDPTGEAGERGKPEWVSRTDEFVHFSQVVEQIADLVMITNREGIIDYVNPAFERMTGYSLAEVIGKKPNIVKSGEHSQEFYADIWRTLTEGRPYQGEIVNRRKDGTLYYCEKTITPYRNDKGELTHFVSTDKEITERRRAEICREKLNRELRRANEELERFASIAAHDLQAPLRTIICHLELIERWPSSTASRAKSVEFVMAAARKMHQMIRDLLVYSRVGGDSKNLVLVDCDRLVKEVVDSMQTSLSECGASIDRMRLPSVLADSTQLAHVFQNLIANALKYRRGNPPKIRIEARQRDSEWVFLVNDNGIGIPSEYFSKLFVMFSRLHTEAEYPGTGIGLAICRRVVETHGGKIWIESQPGVGSTFFFSIPLHPDTFH